MVEIKAEVKIEVRYILFIFTFSFLFIEDMRVKVRGVRREEIKDIIIIE